MFLDLVFLSLITEGITELLVKSEFFLPLRKFFFDRNKLFIHKLLNCGYCTSVWIGLFICIYYLFDFDIYNILFIGIFVHRLSNIIHFTIDSIRNSG